MNEAMRYLSIEGNIGAGKSTFLSLIQKHLHIDVIYEPTDKWQRKDKGENLLDLFYRDTQRWAYTFQSYAFITRIQSQIEHQKTVKTHNIQVYERSVYCDRYCFAKNCFEMGLMSAMEWNIYREWFSWLVETYTHSPTGIVYLRTTPEVCHQRIQRRARSEETDIPLSYLTSLHERHEEWLMHGHDMMAHIKDSPILVLDCNPEFEDDLGYQLQLIEQLNAFITDLETPGTGSLGERIPGQTPGRPLQKLDNAV